MTRRHSLAALFALLAVVVSACTGGTSATSSAGQTPEAAPAAGPTTTAAPAPACGDPTASLRPTGPLPPPKQMPAGTFMQTIQARGRLIVGVDQNTLLFGSLNPFDGTIEGFDIDMLHQVAAAILGDPNAIEYRAITSAQRIPMVQNGTVDIVAETMTINCARIKQVSFSTVYYRAGQKVLVRSDSKATGIGDLAGRKVCAAAGSTSIDNIRNAASHPVPVVVDDWTDCLVGLQRNQVDAISTDDAILAGLAAQDPYTKVVGPRFTDEPYGMAINLNHPDFVRFVNGVLDRMRADGTWAAIYAKWLAARLGPQTAPPATYSG
jgi:polar amino acid transport system substrate-binding protein